MIGAHPDDEDSALLAYLARGENARTAYLSLTRGDGGQDLIGPELGDALGILRTQELLEARRIDGGEQFFTRAVDFGYSKSPEESFAKWGRQEVLADVVRVIRQFRPDVIITRFPPEVGGGHGHHTASAQLARRLFLIPADAAFDQLPGLGPGRRGGCSSTAAPFSRDVRSRPRRIPHWLGRRPAPRSAARASYTESRAQPQPAQEQGFGAAEAR